MQAIVDTEGTGCNKALGECWLPPYPNPSHDGEPLLAQKVGSDACQKSAQANCWPHPGDEVTLVCLTQAKGLLWYAFRVPPEHMPVGSEAKETIGFNQVQWLRVKEGERYTTLPGCPIG